MKFRFGRREAVQDHQLADLEACLQSYLTPIAPRPAFISELKGRLMNAPTPERTFGLWHYAAFVAAGALSGIVIVATGVRLTLTLAAALGLLSRARQKSPAPVRPAL
ncbi:MAG: hypothetical protein AB1894_03550 [Chloroflexota bacterium]